MEAHWAEHGILQVIHVSWVGMWSKTKGRPSPYKRTRGVHVSRISDHQ